MLGTEESVNIYQRMLLGACEGGSVVKLP